MKTKTYKVDKNKNIGIVVFVVEGGRADTGGTELRLLKNIFTNILGYEVQELRRGCDEFIGHGSNPYSRVFALNLPKNQLTQLNEDSIDLLFKRLKKEFAIKPEDCPIFYLYDRDFKSYGRNELRGKYVKKYTDPYSNDNGDQGQLLLSYPAVESYLLSCVLENIFEKEYFLGRDVKPELEQQGISVDNIVAEEQLVHATVEMDKGLFSFGIADYDLDNLAPTLLNTYDAQQEKCKNDKKFKLLSLISMALLELGVIVECTDNCTE